MSKIDPKDLDPKILHNLTEILRLFKNVKHHKELGWSKKKIIAEVAKANRIENIIELTINVAYEGIMPIEKYAEIVTRALLEEREKTFIN